MRNESIMHNNLYGINLIVNNRLEYGKGFIIDNNVYMNSRSMYSFIFATSGVNKESIQECIRIALSLI